MHKVAAYNGTTTNLSVADLDRIDGHSDKTASHEEGKQGNTQLVGGTTIRLSMFNLDHAKSLFASRKLAYSTGLLISLWGEVHTLYSDLEHLLTTPVSLQL
jgi:hypothetical protein